MACTDCAAKRKQSTASNWHVKSTVEDSAAFIKSVNLARCYLCAKKHISAAKILFKEYHTGYSDHIKNLMESLRVAEDKVREAFILWQDIMGQLDMAEVELVGMPDLDKIDPDHVRVANLIRSERINLSDNVFYKPDFDSLLVEVQLLQLRY